MMLPGVIRAANAGLTSTNTEQGYGTVITASASANTKGSWVELIASTASDCCCLETSIVMEGLGGVRSVAVDIGIGAAASETVLVPDIVNSPRFNGITQVRVALPMHIPAGTRIAARAASSAAGSKTSAVHVVVWNGSLPTEIAGVDAINFASASTTGTTITPNGTPGVKGSYSELIASTTRDYIGLFGVWGQPGGLKQNNKLDIAIGAAASETIIMPDRHLYVGDDVFNLGDAYDAVIFPYLPVHIPVGSRIAARSSGSNTDAIPIVLYGAF